MKAVVAYYKSKLGILRLSSVILGAIVVGLSTYSHFNSHWSYHSRHVEMQERTESFLNTENDYEDCFQNSRIYPNVLSYNSAGSPYRSVESGFFDPDQHARASGTGTLGSGDKLSSATCPKPILELFLVSISISVLLLSMCIILRISVEHLKAWSFFDILFHANSSFFLLLGSGIFFHSAYHISEWCSLKSKLSSSGYFVHNMVMLDSPGDQSLSGDVTVNPVLGGKVGVGRLDSNEMPTFPHNIDEHVALLHTSVTDYDEACNLTHLTAEKYWACIMAILAAIVHGVIAAFLFKASRRNAVNAEGTARQQRDGDGTSRRNSKGRRDSRKRKSGDDSGIRDEEGGLEEPAPTPRKCQAKGVGPDDDGLLNNNCYYSSITHI